LEKIASEKARELLEKLENSLPGYETEKVAARD
jgi:hypothetical protein